MRWDNSSPVPRRIVASGKTRFIRSQTASGTSGPTSISLTLVKLSSPRMSLAYETPGVERSSNRSKTARRCQVHQPRPAAMIVSISNSVRSENRNQRRLGAGVMGSFHAQESSRSRDARDPRHRPTRFATGATDSGFATRAGLGVAGRTRGELVIRECQSGFGAPPPHDSREAASPFAFVVAIG